MLEGVIRCSNQSWMPHLVGYTTRGISITERKPSKSHSAFVYLSLIFWNIFNKFSDRTKIKPKRKSKKYPATMHFIIMDTSGSLILSKTGITDLALIENRGEIYDCNPQSFILRPEDFRRREDFRPPPVFLTGDVRSEQEMELAYSACQRQHLSFAGRRHSPNFVHLAWSMKREIEYLYDLRVGENNNWARFPHYMSIMCSFN